MAHYFAASLILGVLGVISFEDYKYNKILNKRVALIFFIGFSYYAIAFILWAITKQFNIEYLNFTNSAEFLIILKNLLITTILSYTLWHYDIWSGGDAKVFIALSFGLPIYFYQNGTLFNTFPSFVLMINIFFIPFFILFIRLLFFPLHYLYFLTQKKDLKKATTTQNDYKRIMKIFMGIIITYTVYRVIKTQIVFFADQSLDLNSFFSIYLYLASFFLYLLIKKVLFKRYLLPVALLSLISYFTFYYFFSFLEFKNEIINIFIFGLASLILVILINKFYNTFIYFYEMQPITLNKLKPGMILDSTISSRVKHKMLKNKLNQIQKNLTKKDIDSLQAFFKQNPKIPHQGLFLIQKTTHFGLWFFIGTLMTIILKTSILHFFQYN